MADIFDEVKGGNIEDALASGGKQLTEAQVIELKEFVELVGGIENAQMAIDLLADLEGAA